MFYVNCKIGVMVYIVSCDLNVPGRRCEALSSLIRREGDWARIGGSAFLLESSKTPVELRDIFKGVLDSNDKLYVGQVATPAAWTGLSKEVSDWIKKKL